MLWQKRKKNTDKEIRNTRGEEYGSIFNQVRVGLIEKVSFNKDPRR